MVHLCPRSAVRRWQETFAYRGQVKLFRVANVSYRDQSFNSVRNNSGLLALILPSRAIGLIEIRRIAALVTKAV
jgi:hypothetical protein